MPETTEERHPQKNDFVIVDPDPKGTRIDQHTGVVKEVSRNDDEKPISYSISLWGSNGPKNVVLYFDAPEVAIHPKGRESVIDESSKMRFNNR